MKTVRFFFDYASPWTYIGSTQIERVAREAGGTIEWVPMLLGGVFKSIGTPNVPLFTLSPARQRYQMRDFLHWAEYWGIPFGWPSRFPMNTVLPLRATLAAPVDEMPRIAHAIFRAFWVEDRDISDKATVAAILSAIGLDGAALVTAADDPAVKNRLRENTDGAVAAGVFGAPTFLIDDQLVFGQDRLDFVRAALEGKRL